VIRNYRRLLEIWNTDYGRAGGWLIEKQGEPIGVLFDAVCSEMFWERYRIRSYGENDRNSEVTSEAFWRNFDFAKIKFRSIAVGEIAKNAIPAIDPFDNEGRVSIRGLYVNARDPSFWDRMVLFVYRLMKQRPGCE